MHIAMDCAATLRKDPEEAAHTASLSNLAIV